MTFFTSEQIAALSDSTVRLDLLVEFRFAAGTKRLWNGNTELLAGGHVWQPFRGAASIDGLSVANGATAETVTFTLTGIPDDRVDLLSEALAGTDDVAQRLVVVHMQLFDDRWQPVGVPIGIWWGFMQPPRVRRTAATETVGGTQSVSMTAENAFFNRARPPAGRLTDRDQKTRAPGDRFCEFVSSLVFKSFRYPLF